MNYIKTNNDGLIVGRFFSELPEAIVPDGFFEVGQAPDDATHYINGVFSTQAPPAPVYEIEGVRHFAKAKINAARDAEEVAGFTAYGKTFDSDKTSQQRILIAANTAQVVGSSFTIDWTTADNSVITLDYAQMLGLPVIMAQAGNALHQKARTLKAQIDAATTLEEINAVAW